MPVANPAAIKASGGDYTTIQAWEDAMVNNEGVLVGECYGEAFTLVLFDGVAYDASNYPHLTAHAGNEHDGRAHEVSAAGNARIDWSGADNIVKMYDEYIRLSWLEVKGPGNNNRRLVEVGLVGASTAYVHHNILHNNHASTGIQYGISLGDLDPVPYVYRNIIYGMGRSGVETFAAAAGAVCLCNTIYENNVSETAGRAGILTGDIDFAITNNACFDNPVADIGGTAGTLDYNASADTTADDEGANSIANLTTANQFVAPTTTWASTDLLVKAAADIIGEGTTFSAATYPEIDVSIRNGATRATITGAWDIGADQYEAAAPAGQPMMLRATTVPGMR